MLIVRTVRHINIDGGNMSSLKASIFALALLGLAACGSGDDAQPTTATSPATTTATSQPTPVANGEAWDRLVKRAQGCAPRERLLVDHMVLKSGVVAPMIIITNDDASETAVHAYYKDGTLNYWSAYRTILDEGTGVKSSALIAREYDSSERNTAAQIMFRDALNAIGCTS